MERLSSWYVKLAFALNVKYGEFRKLLLEVFGENEKLKGTNFFYMFMCTCIARALDTSTVRSIRQGGEMCD